MTNLIRILCLVGFLSIGVQGHNRFYGYFAQLFQSVEPTAASCSVKFKDFPPKEPLILVKDKTAFALYQPHDTAISLKTGENISIACTGTKNIISSIGSDLVSVSCNGNNKFTYKNKAYSLNDLACDKAITGEVQETKDKCGNTKGAIKHIGDTISKNGWVTLFDVCYDENSAEALYADHTLFGSAIKNAKAESGRPGFKVPGTPAGVPIAKAYTQAAQKEAFKRLLGTDELIDARSFLARGHLAPDGDFVFGTSQFSSYFFINVVPQWQAVNNGNWKSLEFSVRNAADSLKKDLRVITGGHEILKLKSSKGKNINMYLIDGNKLPIPKFVWKVVYDPKTQKGIAFVSLNNPFVKTMAKEDIMCKDVCKNYGWGTDNWKDTSKGYIYCCDVNELAKTVKTIPKLTVKGVLSSKNNSKSIFSFFNF